MSSRKLQTTENKGLNGVPGHLYDTYSHAAEQSLRGRDAFTLVTHASTYVVCESTSVTAWPGQGRSPPADTLLGRPSPAEDKDRCRHFA
eukprot:174447-Prorocentrum_minimum.AAC.1